MKHHFYKADWQEPACRQGGKYENPHESVWTSPGDGDIFFGGRVAALSDIELEELIRKGVIFDMDAMKILNNRGLLPKMGVEELSASDRNNIINIDFTDQGRPDDWNIYYFLRNLPDPAWPVEFKASNEVRLYSYMNHSKEKTAPFAVKWTGAEGQRFGFINFSYDRWPIYAWLHPWMAEIMGELADWIKGEPLEVIVKDRPRVAVEMCETEEGKILLTVINYSTGSYEDIILSLSGKPERMRWVEIMENGKEKVCKVKKTASGSEINSGTPIHSLGVKFFVGE